LMFKGVYWCRTANIYGNGIPQVVTIKTDRLQRVC